MYTGLSSAGALETGLTTHHTYGMPMLAGSSVKGATASYAEKIGLPENVRQILFGDEDNAGAVVWHDAWWIPNGKPFAGEIITTHHQEYYNGKQEHADEMENSIPNQQIACQGSFYFVVECDNTAWANFANQLLFEMLQNQGMGSKTASGYGYFTVDETEQNRLNAQREEQAQQRAEEEKAEELAAMSEHERFIAKWKSKLSDYLKNNAVFLIRRIPICLTKWWRIFRLPATAKRYCLNRKRVLRKLSLPDGFKNNKETGLVINA
nr:type III-B CRISPR module RAMP protein Cmr6 [Alysiella crassa]UOP06821.1 type III-B CRISPR module RAMP protein Cmr6 [Alysiella crassa]